MGWSYLDHTKEATLEKHGEWYLSTIDQVAQSMGYWVCRDRRFNIQSCCGTEGGGLEQRNLSSRTQEKLILPALLYVYAMPSHSGST